MEIISNILPYFLAKLQGTFDRNEIISWAYISIEFLLKMDRTSCIINSDKKIPDEISIKLINIVDELASNKPIQYVLGEANFYGYRFKVNSHVLIPRSETEELVDWVLKNKFNSVLDIGTGSGCIAIALALNSNAHINAIDLCDNALSLARLNAKQNNVDIKFFKQDILKCSKLPLYDVIVSNPPYVLNSEKKYIFKNVLDFEPHTALFVDDNNPLIFYRKIAQLAFISLNNNGSLYFEINEKFGLQISELLSKIGFVDIQLKKDINDKDRMIKAIKN